MDIAKAFDVILCTKRVLSSEQYETRDEPKELRDGSTINFSQHFTRCFC